MSSLTMAANALSTIGMFLPLIIFSVLAFWKEHYLLFIITAGIAIITGMETPDIMCGAYDTSLLSVTICMLLMYIYAPACIAWAIRLMLKIEGEVE